MRRVAKRAVAGVCVGVGVGVGIGVGEALWFF
jgi:hypothetical protein